ncbi:MAG TPA: Eco57I restriction-modification methylase domain-containing protein, partial [Planctomycetaceae bacterium]
MPDALFDPDQAPGLLKSDAPRSSTYYQAILQNLFFATLNQEMGQREFRKDNQNFMAHTLYRYRRHLKDTDETLRLFAGIPFMNGGLFECLDKQLGTKEKPKYLRIDGFSDRDDNQLAVPNELFFCEERQVDLSEAYGDAGHRSARVRGLNRILQRYKFTLAENTPLEQEVALDPELLGKVFENLLAAYNPETGATARKQTGSFYTPREIVDYMVDESLVATLKPKLDAAFPDVGGSVDDSAPVAGRGGHESRLRHLFAYNDEPHQFAPPEVDAIIEAVDHVKILDPACGSGAFPMGILHKLVFALGKLDPRNERWKARQIAKAEEFRDPDVREKVIAEIEEAFNANELDYGRKLYLIENCIYGVDIQPIAVQISKLRCFISLVVDQKKNEKAENLGIRPLPNLETNFVAANSLIPISRPRQKTLRNPAIDAKERELHRVRERHFSARTPATKAKYRADDARLRAEIGELLEDDGWDHTTAGQLAAWDPYDQNASADFFDTEWMFGVKVGKVRVPGAGKATLGGRFAFFNDLPGQKELMQAGEIDSGFDIVIGNPPYVRIQNIPASEATLLKGQYASATGKFDVYVLFVEQAFRTIREHGFICFIHPHRFLTADYGRGIKTYLDKVHGLRSAILFGVDQVFAAATTYTGVFSFSRDNRSFRFKHATSADFASIPFVDRDYSPSGEHWELSTADNSSSALVAKLRNQSIKLSDICHGIYQGIVTVGDDIFVLRGQERGNLFTGWSEAASANIEIEAGIVKPLLKGEHIRRYEPAKSDLAIIYPHIQDEKGKTKPLSEDALRQRFPRTLAYLKPFKSHLVEKKISYKTNPKFWYSLHRARDMSLFEQTKLLTPQLQNRPNFTLDSSGWFPDAGGYSLILKD